MNQYIYLLYSHESYKDILDIHLNQFDKYLKDIDLIICFNNKEYIDNKYSTKYSIIEYDDKLPYMERVINILNKVNKDYIIWVHDINIPIDFPKNDIFNKTVEFMIINNIDQVRMFAAGVSNRILEDFYHEIQNNSYYFSINTAMWKKSSLLLIASKFKGCEYRCSECYEVQKFVKQMKNYYLSSKNDIELNGCNHVISYNFPFCHVLSHGKWSINPYNKQTIYIYKLLNEYNIDINIRGII